MRKKLTITIDEKIYEGLYQIIGKGKISRFIENLIKPYVFHQDLTQAYQEMVSDEESELEAATSSEGAKVQLDL